MSHTESKYTPPELQENAEQVVEDLLPEKSKFRYEKAYKVYKEWCENKKVQNIGSESVVLAYFNEIAKDRKASTLWATYSMLRSTLNVRDKIDISKFANLGAYLKKQNVGYKPKKSSVFTKKDIDRFLNDAPLEYLPQKVALIIGISGACRSDELFKMKTTDLDFLEKKVNIAIPDKKTSHLRAFVVTNAEWIAILNQYMNLRNNIDNKRLFLQFKLGKVTKHPFGHNAIAQFPKKIATYLKLKNADTYTGHCFRRTAGTLLGNSGDVFRLKNLGEWSSTAVDEGDVDISLDAQVKIEPETSTSFSCSSVSLDMDTQVKIEPGTSTTFTCPSISMDMDTQMNIEPGTSTTFTCPSTTKKEFRFSSEQIKHGLSVIINSCDHSNLTITFNNLNPEDEAMSSS